MADVVDESRTSQETEQMALHDTNRDNLAIYIITRSHGRYPPAGGRA